MRTAITKIHLYFCAGFGSKNIQEKQNCDFLNMLVGVLVSIMKIKWNLYWQF
jgi:hypothetical protein